MSISNKRKAPQISAPDKKLKNSTNLNNSFTSNKPSTNSINPTVIDLVKEIYNENPCDSMNINKSRELTEFMRSVYYFTKLIPPGYISTYKAIAVALNKPNASRAVGNALR